MRHGWTLAHTAVVLVVALLQPHMPPAYRDACSPMLLVLLLVAAPVLAAPPAREKVPLTAPRGSAEHGPRAARGDAGVWRSLLARWNASWQAAAADARGAADAHGAGGSEGSGRSGAINEKAVVGARRATQLAPLLHATFGLDHYPNFLQRWQPDAINALEQRLEEQLAGVRVQKALAARRLAAVEAFVPAVPTDLAAIFDERFLATLDGVSGTPRPAMVAKLLTEECDGVLSFPLLRADFCARLVACGQSFGEFVERYRLEPLLAGIHLCVAHTHTHTFSQRRPTRSNRRVPIYETACGVCIIRHRVPVRIPACADMHIHIQEQTRIFTQRIVIGTDTHIHIQHQCLRGHAYGHTGAR